MLRSWAPPTTCLTPEARLARSLDAPAPSPQPFAHILVTAACQQQASGTETDIKCFPKPLPIPDIVVWFFLLAIDVKIFISEKKAISRF